VNEIVAELVRVRNLLATLPDAGDDPARIDAIRLLEEIKSSAAAAQARTTARFVASQRAEQADAGAPAERIGRGIAAQVGLARRCSPYHAQRYVGWAVILTGELPATLAELTAGRTSEWRAMVVARETAWLSRENRARVDAELASMLVRLGDRGVESAVKKAAYRLDPHGCVERIRAAAGERRVGLRPAPEGMSRLSATLPVAQGVACYAALTRAATTVTATGDPSERSRSRGQIMADTLVERVTGQARAEDVAVEIQLVMTDQTLLAAGPQPDEPAHMPGHGPVPAAIARDLAYRTGAAPPRWLRRLYVAPGTNRLVAMESRRRCFTPAQQRFVATRDDTCRTPWCDAPVRHIDHVNASLAGGRTVVRNAQGLCEACNYAKQAPGWRARTEPDGGIVTATPTGHRYRSRLPDHLPGTPAPRPRLRIRRRRPVIDFIVDYDKHAA
jgi:hypothetical protein